MRSSSDGDNTGTKVTSTISSNSLLMPYQLYTESHSCGPDVSVCKLFDFGWITGVPINADNIDRRTKLLPGLYQMTAKLFRHNVVLVPLCEDFSCSDGSEWDRQFENYRALFNYMNGKNEWNVNARFGTVQDYFDEVRSSVALSGRTMEEFFPSLSGDFFPYSDRDDRYWTGYFSTRPFLKGLGRDV